MRMGAWARSASALEQGGLGWRVSQEGVDLVVRHPVECQQGQELLILGGYGPRRLLNLFGSLHAAPLHLVQSLLEAGDVFPVALARQLLALSVGLLVGWDPDLC